MHHVIVRTKLQAILAKKLLDDGVITTPFHLIQLSWAGEPSVEEYCLKLSSHAVKTTKFNRPKSGFISIFLYFLFLSMKSKINRDKIFLANINWYTFALAAKFVPSLKITTFDDGNANIQSSSMFFLEKPITPNNIGGWIARRIFPKGASAFLRERISEHFTIYPGFKNIVDDSKIRVIEMDWDALIEENDKKLLPKNARRILLGTVLEETKYHRSTQVTNEEFQQALVWSDLYIPHPRVPNAVTNNIIKKYTAEMIIGYYLKNGPVTVAHFNSSAITPFQNHPNIVLINLIREDVSILFQEQKLL